MSTKRRKNTVFKMHFDGPESKKAYKKAMSKMGEINENDQPLLGGQRLGRFSKIKFETPEQGAAYIRLIEGSNRVNTTDRTKIGGEALVRPRG